MSERIRPTARRSGPRGGAGTIAASRRGGVGLVVLAVLALGACATARPSSSRGGGATNETTTSIPAGLGTLRQDEFTVELRSDDVLLKATPLTETVIRLAAPDTYERLHALAIQASERARAAAGGSAELWLVSVYSYSTGATFQPEDFQLLQQGRVYREAGVLPLTGGWGRQSLEQRRVESAIYVFRGPLDYEAPISVQYGTRNADGWTYIIPRLQGERARVRSRSGSTPQASIPNSLILR